VCVLRAPLRPEREQVAAESWTRTGAYLAAQMEDDDIMTMTDDALGRVSIFSTDAFDVRSS
jgi:hypothetical protein